MGLHTLGELTSKLIAHGKPASTPAAIVSKGTSAEQKVLAGTLENIAQLQQQARLPAPALVIVGEVVNMHESLSWFGDELVEGRNHTLMNVHHGEASPD
jgi:uroporphyrin-III C-methyltransferase/precorrin-2 dehydrogenase/sirohydrochlorin ferrochelatase